VIFRNWCQSNITNIIFTWVHNTNSEKIILLDCIDIEGTTVDSVPKYHILEPTWLRSSVGRALGWYSNSPRAVPREE
jgi:hypothetical protein